MPKKSLAETHPEVAKQWHPTLNGDLKPSDLAAGSNKKVWWKCEKGTDHEWEAQPNARTGQLQNCPICSNRKIVPSNSLTTTHPKLAKQWHPTKNGILTPNNVGAFYSKRVWWKCDKGADHEWFVKPTDRTNYKTGCPICSNKKVVPSNCLATTHPEIAAEWHPTKNGEYTPFTLGAGSSSNIWWKCTEADDHIYASRVYKKAIEKQGCPFCAGRKVTLSNSLLSTHPELAKQWHPTKNKNLVPEKVYAGAFKRVWWKCPKGNDHEYEMLLSDRKRGYNCPVCRGLKVVKSTSLEQTNPELLKEWNYDKNNIKPSEITVNSNKKVWWKCDKAIDHVWSVDPNSRHTQKSGCPFCTLTPQSKQELTITFELMKLFKNIDPKGLKTKLEGKLRAVDIFIPKLNLCIEFDGSYWHKEQEEIDKIKSEMLFDEGFKVIRVREEPLPKTHDNDVISKKPYNGKQVTNDILSMIMSIFELDAELVSKIKSYQSKDGLQNEKGLDRYIDKILTEKAERNN